MNSTAILSRDDRDREEGSRQLAMWRGSFGNEYIKRNPADETKIAALAKFWRKLNIECHPNSVLEVGANIGRHLRAIRLGPAPELFALEPNELARRILVEEGVVDQDHIVHGSAESIDAKSESFDLVFTSGVLIHIPPERLLDAYNEIYRVSKRYIVCIEYFSDKPETITYRGHGELLFKRDFGAYWLDHFPLKLKDYGFWWKRAGCTENLNWWLFEKSTSDTDAG